MKNFASNHLYGILGTVLFHAVLILILFLITFAQPPRIEDGEGILVQIGIADEAQGDFDPLLSEWQPQGEPAPEETGEAEENITQDTEETIRTVDKEPTKKKSEETKTTPEPPKEDTRIQNQVANAFNKGMSGNNSRGNSSAGTGAQGSPDGNAASGATSGSPGYGNYDLGGRGIIGTLPRPQYDNSNDEGTIVVTITVNPDGKVIAANMGKGSTGLAASNATLRQQAIHAAQKAVFSKSNRTGNQTGTITYYFRQR